MSPTLATHEQWWARQPVVAKCRYAVGATLVYTLVRGRKTGSPLPCAQATALTVDHKTSLPAERKRIHEAGGHINAAGCVLQVPSIVL